MENYKTKPRIMKGAIVNYSCNMRLMKKGVNYSVKSQFMEVVKRRMNYVWIRHIGTESEGVSTRLRYLTFVERIKK